MPASCLSSMAAPSPEVSGLHAARVPRACRSPVGALALEDGAVITPCRRTRLFVLNMLGCMAGAGLYDSELERGLWRHVRNKLAEPEAAAGAAAAAPLAAVAGRSSC